MFGITPFAKVSFAAIGVAFVVATTEDVGVADSQVFNAQYVESVTETITQIFDVQSEQDNFFEGIVETLTSADSSTQTSAFLESQTENITSADTETITAQFAVNDTENINLADTPSINAQFSVSDTENTGIADSSTQTSSFLDSQTENITLADTEAASIQFQFTVTEPITSAESENISAQFSETIVEAWGQTPYSVPQQPSIASFAMAGSPFAGNFNSIGFLENPSYIVQANLLDSITENTTITETETITAQFPLSVAENTTVLDTPTITAQFLESLNENFGIADFSTQVSNFLESLTEATTIAEVETIIAGFVESIVEPTTLNNSQSITAQFVEIIAEAITVVDSSTQQSNFLDSIVEAFTILDSQITSGWIRIDDSETANWGFRNQIINEIGGFATSTFAGTPFAGDLNFSKVVPNPIIDVNIPNWATINNTENASWNYRNQIINEIGGFATCTFGGTPFAGYLSFSGIVPNPILDQNTPSWAGISNNQTTNWVLINNTQ